MCIPFHYRYKLTQPTRGSYPAGASVASGPTVRNAADFCGRWAHGTGLPNTGEFKKLDPRSVVSGHLTWTHVVL